MWCLFTSGTGASFGLSSVWALIIDFRVPSSNWCTQTKTISFMPKDHNEIFTHVCTCLKSVELILQHDFYFQKSLLFLLELLKATQHSGRVFLQHYWTQKHETMSIVVYYRAWPQISETNMHCSKYINFKLKLNNVDINSTACKIKS